MTIISKKTTNQKWKGVPLSKFIGHVYEGPIISRASVDRPNIYLACEEIPTAASKTKFSYFA